MGGYGHSGTAASASAGAGVIEGSAEVSELNEAALQRVNDVIKRSDASVKQLEQEASASWGDSSHLLHGFEKEEVRLTDALLALSELREAAPPGSAFEVRMRDAERKASGIGARIARAKAQCVF